MGSIPTGGSNMANVFNNGRGGRICDKCKKLMCSGTGTRRKLDPNVTKKIIYKKSPSGKELEFCCPECASAFFNKVKK